MSHDLTPLKGPYPEPIQAILERYYPRRDGELLTLFQVFARSPRLLAKLGAGGLLDRESPLARREREIVILRVTANNGCEYEWGVHVTAFAKSAGFTAEQIEATRLADADAACWTEQERNLLQAVDELGKDGRMASATRERFTAQWRTEQQLEILALCGFYTTVSLIANTAALAPEPWAARFPV